MDITFKDIQQKKDKTLIRFESKRTLSPCQINIQVSVDLELTDLDPDLPVFTLAEKAKEIAIENLSRNHWTN